MASQMQIGQGAQWTERAHQEGSSVLDRQQFLGTAGRRDPWHSVQQRPSIWQQVWLWMRKILVGMFGSHLDPTVIYCDN